MAETPTLSNNIALLGKEFQYCQDDTLHVLLASKSPVKLAAVQKRYARRNIVIDTCDPDIPFNAPQPVEPYGLVCAKLRLQFAREIAKKTSQLYNHIIAIESSLDLAPESQSESLDIVNVIVMSWSEEDGKWETRAAKSEGIPVPQECVARLRECNGGIYRTTSGYAVTIGELLQSAGKVKDPKNWMAELYGYDRVDQICGALFKCVQYVTFNADHVAGLLEYTVDFPKPGVLFKDMSLLMAHHLDNFLGLCVQAINTSIPPYKLSQITHIVGLEARGFHLGAALASRLACGFVMIRKGGKLPPRTASVAYGTEYSKDTVEIDIDVFCGHTKPGVLIVDDLVATGGSLIAAAQLLALCHNAPNVEACFTPLAVPELLETTRVKLWETRGVKLVTLDGIVPKIVPMIVTSVQPKSPVCPVLVADVATVG